MSVNQQKQMKKLTLAFTLALASAVVLTGCIPMTYTRSITVHKDASGNISADTPSW